MFWIGLIVGLMVGTLFGFILGAACKAASISDAAAEREFRERQAREQIPKEDDTLPNTVNK